MESDAEADKQVREGTDLAGIEVGNSPMCLSKVTKSPMLGYQLCLCSNSSNCT